MKQLRMTKKNIEVLPLPEKGRDTYKCEKVPFLQLFVNAGGSKVFYYVRKHDGKVVFMKLGAFPDLSVLEAQREAERTAGKYAKGEDPQAAKREVQKTITFGELFAKYMTLYAKPKKRTWEEDQRKYDKHLKGWENIKAAKINKEDILRLHSKLTTENGGYLANRTFALIRAVLNFGIELGLDINNPCSGMKGKLYQENSREEFLTPEKLGRFFKALDEEPNQDMVDFFKLALFTGARKSNVLAMCWKDIDLNESVWTVPPQDSKSKDKIKIHLANEALAIIMRRKLEAESKAKYVFPSKSRSGHLADPKRAWKRICERAEISGMRIHDLRRTLGSYEAASGASLQIIGKTLGHKQTKTTEIYARLDFDPVRNAVNTAVNDMMKVVEVSNEG